MGESRLDVDSLAMRRVQAGELDQFTELVARHQSALFRYAVSRLGSRTLAEDAVQDTFLRAFEGRRTFDCQRGFRAWLWTILIHRCGRLAKDKSRLPTRTLERDEAPVDGSQWVGERLERAEERRLLEELLVELPEEQADALRMRYFGELSYEEIGDASGTSVSTAKSRVRYGLERLARALATRREITR